MSPTAGVGADHRGRSDPSATCTHHRSNRHGTDVHTEVLTPSRVTPASREAITGILKTPRPPTQADEAPLRFARRAAVCSSRDCLPWNSNEPPLPPGKAGPTVDRLGRRRNAGFLTTATSDLDEFGSQWQLRDRPILQVSFPPGLTDKVPARFDDGAAAMVERAVAAAASSRRPTMDKSGTTFTATLFRRWSTRPRATVALDRRYTVGRMLDVSVPIAAMSARCGDTPWRRGGRAASDEPSGAQVTVGEGGAGRRAVEQVYSARAAGAGGTGGRSGGGQSRSGDPTHTVASGRVVATATAAGRDDRRAVPRTRSHPRRKSRRSRDGGTCSRRRLVLLVEAVLANRLSKRFGFGLSDSRSDEGRPPFGRRHRWAGPRRCDAPGLAQKLRTAMADG
jgi:hypothetical protein